MSARRTGRAAGFTLVELMVTVTLSVVVILGALALLGGQQRAFRSSAGDRALQETARVALESLSRNLRLAGFGVDPALALDFGPQANVRMARAPSGTVVAAASYQCNAAVSCRDRTDGPDEIVFLARDPGFGQILASAYVPGSTSLEVRGPLRSTLYKGQILQVMCFTGSMAWAYVTVSARVLPTEDGSFSIPIDGGNTAFPNQTAFLDADGCFGNAIAAGVAPTEETLSTATKVFKVDRFRYFVGTFDEASGDAMAWGSAGRPYLLLDQGLLDASGNAIVDVVAPDVEDLQVSYTFAPTVTQAPTSVGTSATAGTAIASGADGLDVTPAAGVPAFGDEPDVVQRTTHHPANVRGVGISLVVRAPAASAAVRPEDAIVPAAGNRRAVAGPDGFRRLLIQTSVPVRNLDSRAPYYPFYGTGGDQLNVAGG
jgi:type IV pilus assembly protein PilW